MIVAFESTDQPAAGAALSGALATLCAAGGRRAAVVSPDSINKLSRIRSGGETALMDASVSSWERSAAVLAAADVVVVLVDPHTLGERNGCLLTRLRTSASTNPRRRILVTVVPGALPMSLKEAATVLIFVARIGKAQLSHTLVLDDAGAHVAHRRQGGNATFDEAELRHLYRHVFESAEAMAC